MHLLPNLIMHYLYIVIVLIRVSIAEEKYHDPKAGWGGKGLFGFHFQITVHHQKKSGQDLKQDRILRAGTDAEATEGCCFLACSLQIAQPVS